LVISDLSRHYNLSEEHAATTLRNLAEFFIVVANRCVYQRHSLLGLSANKSRSATVSQEITSALQFMNLLRRGSVSQLVRSFHHVQEPTRRDRLPAR
jgi:hypothetical protein